MIALMTISFFPLDETSKLSYSNFVTQSKLEGVINIITVWSKSVSKLRVVTLLSLAMNKRYTAKL
jgi:hypothetical protein